MARIGILKALQILTSFAVVIFVFLVYPGAMAILAAAIGFAYVAAALLAAFDRRPAVWLAAVFTCVAAALSTTGVLRFADNGFDFLGGGFAGVEGITVVPYLLAGIAALSNLTALLLLASWRWLLFGSKTV